MAAFAFVAALHVATPAPAEDVQGDPAAHDDRAAHAPAAVLPERRPDIVLDPVVVTATRLPQHLGDVSAAVSVVERGDIRDGRPTVGLDESLARVPGVFIQNNENFSQDLRIQIRGFGTRAAFGVREIKVLVDGLPETLPDGQTETDALDLGAVDHVEVLRGPASALYGNASGGVMQIFTDEPPATPHVGVRLMGGSYGLGKYDVAGGGTAGNAGVALHAGFVQLGGYRDHAAADRGTMTAKLRWALGDVDAMVLLSGLSTWRADDPGGLTGPEVRADRRQARALNVALDAGEEVSQGRIGTVLRRVTDHTELSAYGYVLYRDFEGRLPIPADAGDGITTFTRLSPGIGARFAYTATFLGAEHTLLAGLDVQHQADARRRFANVGGSRGRLGLDQDETVTSIGPYVRWLVALGDDVEVNAGVRYDRVRFDVDVHAPVDSDDSDTRTLDAWSPAGGVTWRPRRWLSLFANAGTAFQTPTTTELADPDGAGFNRALDPQTSTNVEAGARVAWPGRGMAGVTAFYLDLRDTLIPFESESGRTFFRNVGRSERYGVEVEAQLALTDTLRWSGAFTFTHAEFRRYRNANGDFAGNEEPGIPGAIFFGELLYRQPGGVYAGVETTLVDGFWADDANTARTPAYVAVNLRAGWDGMLRGVHLEPFVGIQNVSDATYNGVVRLNAAGGRFFEPAPGINVFGGVGIRVDL